MTASKDRKMDETPRKPRFRLKRGEEWDTGKDRWGKRVHFHPYADRCCGLCRFYQAAYEGEGDCCLPAECGIEIPDPEFGPQCRQRALFDTGEAATCDFFSPAPRP